MSIEITVVLAIVNARAPLRALADVTLCGLGVEITIRRCAVFEKTGQPAWVSLPRISIEKHGKKSFVALVELPRELRQRVFDAVLARYRQLCDED
jgi:hypothetical protein